MATSIEAAFRNSQRNDTELLVAADTRLAPKLMHTLPLQTREESSIADLNVLAQQADMRTGIVSQASLRAANKIGLSGMLARLDETDRDNVLSRFISLYDERLEYKKIIGGYIGALRSHTILSGKNAEGQWIINSKITHYSEKQEAALNALKASGLIADASSSTSKARKQTRDALSAAFTSSESDSTVRALDHLVNDGRRSDSKLPKKRFAGLLASAAVLIT